MWARLYDSRRLIIFALIVAAAGGVAIWLNRGHSGLLPLPNPTRVPLATAGELLVRNEASSILRVAPWDGAPAVTVSCRGVTTFEASAHPLPWHLTISSPAVSTP